MGTSSASFWETPWNWVWPLFWGVYLLFLHSAAPLVLLAGAFFYGSTFSIPSPGETTALFAPSSLQPHPSPFQKELVYKGTLHLPHSSVPCAIYYRGKIEDHPPAHQNYWVNGRLEQRGDYDFFFKVKKWEPIARSWHLAELRYRTKEKVKAFFAHRLSSPKVSSFLSALLTGDVEDRLLRYEFGRLGLQHILAISGFHFAILIGFLSFFLSLFLPRFWQSLFLMVAMSLYFAFIGSNPAVERSWLTATFYLLGKLLNRHTNGLNLLGSALLIEIALDPLVSINLGFQLSFFSCGGILLLFSFFEKRLRRFFPRRTSSEIGALTFLSKHAYLLSSFLRQAMALTFAVNLLLFPLLLYHFHTFPFLSLFYNLFFPFLVGIALFALLLSVVLYFLFPPLAALLFFATNAFTQFLLDIVSFPILPLNYSIHWNGLPAWAIPIYLFIILMLTIHYRSKDRDRNRFSNHIPFT